jgi:[FeFe] hydrogenase H-cluster maturation GTPase HydF
MSKGKELKPHIGIFGRRNNGKSSVINVLTGQEVAIVSETPGTTTDPVKKSVEIPGVGPVIVIDTAGIDDVGMLGEKRMKRSRETIKQIDFALLVIAGNTWDSFEEQLADEFYKAGVPFIVVHNKKDIQPLSGNRNKLLSKKGIKNIDFAASKPDNLEELVQLIRKEMPPTAYRKKTLLGDLVSYGDIVLLITPIDIEAPEGRLILPQVQTIRDLLDNDCVAIVLKDREVDGFLKKTQIKPKLAVTDSSIFLKADASIPKDIPLTGFSVLLARHKGDFEHYLEGTPKISKLKDNDRILFLESCTHHVSCDDIGRVKIPRWLTQFTGKKLEFDTVSGLNNLSRPIQDYALVVQCGGCVITPKQIMNRLKPAVDASVPVTNYGMAIAYMQGVYERAIEPFIGKVSLEENYI